MRSCFIHKKGFNLVPALIKTLLITKNEFGSNSININYLDSLGIKLMFSQVHTYCIFTCNGFWKGGAL